MLYFFFCYIAINFLGSLIFEGVSRRLFPILVNVFQLISNVAKTTVLDVAGVLDLPVLLKVLLFGVIFLKVLVSEFALIFGLL